MGPVTPSPRASARPARSWRRELILLGVLYLAYAASRLLSFAPADAAVRNARWVLDVEQALRIAPEHTLNDLLYSAPTWVAVASAYFYMAMHYVVTTATLIWLYRSGTRAYRRARNWLVAMTFPALLVFWLFPVAPPRVVPGAVSHDIVAEQHSYGWWGAGGGTAPRGLAALVNENAAMPSLHVGWALWVGWNLVHGARNPLVRAFGYLYPALTVAVVISTGNHYLLDVLAGALLAFAAKIVGERVASRRSRRRAAPVGTRRPRRLSRSSARTASRPSRRPARVGRGVVAVRHRPSRSAPPTTDRPRARGGRRALRTVALIGAAISVIVLDTHLIAPYFTRAASALRDPTVSWVVIAFAAEIASLMAAAQLQRRMLKATGLRVPMHTAVGLTYSAYAVSASVPAGPAVSAGYTFRRLRRLGATTQSAGFTLLSTGVMSTLAYGLVAVAGFLAAGGSSGGAFSAIAAVASSILLVLAARAVLRHPEVLDRIGAPVLRVLNRIRRRDPDSGREELQRSTRTLSSIRPSGRDWAVALAAAVTNWIADLSCLFACCLAVGADGVTLGVVLLAYLAGTGVSGISLVPGGLGVVDAALILILVRNGVAPSTATAAVLLYRILSLGFGLLVGWSAWVIHARAVRRADATAESGADATADTTPRTSTDPPSIRRKDDHDTSPRDPLHDPRGTLPTQASPPPRAAAISGRHGRRGTGTGTGAGPDAGTIRLPRRWAVVTGPGQHPQGVRRDRRPTPVRHRRVEPRTGPRVVARVAEPRSGHGPRRLLRHGHLSRRR